MKNLIEQHPIFTFRVIYWTLYVVLLLVLNMQQPTLIALTIGIFGILSVCRMVTALVAMVLVKYKDYDLQVTPHSLLEINDKYIG